MHTAASAYLSEKYVFRAPPVYTGRWSAEDWMNYVTYTVPISDGYKIHEDDKGNVWYRKGEDPHAGI